VNIHLNRPNVWRLSVAGALIATDLVEGRPRYHLHNHARFDADLAHGRYTVSINSTASAVWTTPFAMTVGLGTVTLVLPEMATSLDVWSRYDPDGVPSRRTRH